MKSGYEVSLNREVPEFHKLPPLHPGRPGSRDIFFGAKIALYNLLIIFFSLKDELRSFEQLDILPADLVIF